MKLPLQVQALKPSVIAFDVFGTLVQIGERRRPYKELMKWLKDHGRRPNIDDAALIMSRNLNLDELMDLFSDQIPDDIRQQLNTGLEKELQSIRLFEDTLCCLDALKKSGFKLALCSNLAMPYGEVVAKILPDFDVYAWSYEVGAIKPDPKIYQYIIDQLACKPEEVRFIGDTPLADVEGPTLFGMSAHLIDRKNGQGLQDVLKDLLM